MIQKISPITNSAKKFMYGILAAGALTAGAAKISASNSTSPIQNQYPSEQVAHASQANAFSNTTNLKVHNKNRDELYVKFAEDDKEYAEMAGTVNVLYDKYGTYAANVLIQKTIDANMLDCFLRGWKRLIAIDPNVGGYIYKTGEEVLDGAKKANEPVMNWYMGTYWPIIGAKIAQSVKANNNSPSYEVCSKMLDDFAENDLKSILDEKDCFKYKMLVKEYKEKGLKNGTSVEDKSNILCYQMHVIDALVIHKLLNSYNVFDSKYVNSEGITAEEIYWSVVGLTSPPKKD